eukprot:805839-Pyramimonas_sp.AAC.1
MLFVLPQVPSAPRPQRGSRVAPSSVGVGLGAAVRFYPKTTRKNGVEMNGPSAAVAALMGRFRGCPEIRLIG